MHGLVHLEPEGLCCQAPSFVLAGHSIWLQLGRCDTPNLFGFPSQWGSSLVVFLWEGDVGLSCVINCLEQFKSAYGAPVVVKITPTIDGITMDGIQDILQTPAPPTCPLCRGNVTLLIVIDETCVYPNMKKWWCEEKHCSYIINFSELWKHGQLKHPYSHPSKIQPCTTTWPGKFSAALTDHRCLENYTCRSTPWSGFRWVRHRTWGCRCQRWAWRFSSEQG